MDRKISFGSNLKELRKKHGYTRKSFASEMDYSEKAVEKWELSDSKPSLETVCKIADFFEVTVDSLIYREQTQIKYLLAIDGGGTKTEFLLTDTDKKEISHIILGASNPVDIGIENTKKILEQGINYVCSGINLKEVSVFAGIAGGITGNNKLLIEEFLSKLNFGFYSNGSDTENVLEMALCGKDGVAVIMGTGIIAFSQTDGKRFRVGGWGYHIDKGGCGYNIASDAMCRALKYIDGRDGSVILKDLIENKLGKPLEESIGDIYQGGKAYIASFAPLVFEAYDKGDKHAYEIIEANVKETAEIILAAVKHLKKEKNVVICGGLCKRADIISQLLKKYLPADIEVKYVNKAMVYGALMIADKLRKGSGINA